MTPRAMNSSASSRIAFVTGGILQASHKSQAFVLFGILARPEFDFGERRRENDKVMPLGRPPFTRGQSSRQNCHVPTVIPEGRDNIGVEVNRWFLHRTRHLPNDAHDSIVSDGEHNGKPVHKLGPVVP
jgi:hypothetical protein